MKVERVAIYIGTDLNIYQSVFIEKILENSVKCIAISQDTNQPIRIGINKKDISFESREKTSLIAHKLYFHVKSIEESSQLYGSGNYFVILNSILQLSFIDYNNNKIIYALISGRKTLLFDHSDIQYIPMINNNYNNNDNFFIGDKVIAICNNVCHNINKNQKYIVKDFIIDPNSILYGTLYLEDDQGKYITTYPNQVKKINI